ncbi:MAG: MFS transporter [Anaerolineae bacterium]|nr:MFS transporter [Anaerolineae bacterium]
MNNVSTNDSLIDYSRKWYVMLAVSLGVFLATIDGSIVNVALPTLVRELQTNFATVQWVVLAYLLTLTTLMPTVGRLADMLGKKPIYAAGFVVFTLGSLLCGLAPTIYWLIFFRVVKGIGAAMVFALGAAIITEAFPQAERGKALGITGSIVSIGIVIGPTLGGLLLQTLSWHWIFFVNLPVGLIGVLLVWRFIAPTQPKGRQTFDFAGAVTLFIALLSLLLALTLGQSWGFGDWRILLLLGGWLLFMVIFVAIEWRATQPMIALSLFTQRNFNINLGTGFLVFMAVAGALILIPFYLENMLGYDNRQVGFLMIALPVALGIAAPVSGVLSDRLGTRPLAVAGLAVMVSGYLALSSLSTETTVWGFIWRYALIGLGVGIFQSPNNSAVMGSSSREQLGVVSGLLAVTRSLGQTTGIALLGTFWAGRVFFYEGRILPEGATGAGPLAQVNGLQDTFIAAAILSTLALCLGGWGLMRARQKRKKFPDVAPPEINIP